MKGHPPPPCIAGNRLCRPTSFEANTSTPLRDKDVSTNPNSTASSPQRTPLPIPPSTPNSSAAPVGEKKRPPRGTSFSVLEDEALTKSWIRISEDAIVGSEQKGEVFYKAIKDYYEAIKHPYCQKRNDKSVERRVRKILSECLSFAGCVAKTNNAKPSGTNNENVIHLSTELFNKVDITSITESCGPPFKFISCWRLLKEHPKFDLLLNPPTTQKEASDNDNETEDDAGSEKAKGEDFKRPISRKIAKAIDTKTGLESKRIKITEATLAAQKERNELLKTQQEMALFTSNTDMSDPHVNEYITIMRRRALDRLKASESSKTTDKTDQNAS